MNYKHSSYCCARLREEIFIVPMLSYTRYNINMWRSVGYFICMGVDTVADVSEAPATFIFRIELDPEYGGNVFHRNFSGTAQFHSGNTQEQD
jgi:hypothetical protein